MIDAVNGVLVVLSTVGTYEIGATSIVSPPHLPVLRITLEDMFPWILLWIAVAGVTRLFAHGGSSDRERSKRQNGDWESDYDNET